MTKKEYMKPAMRSVELRHRPIMLDGSLVNEYGVHRRLRGRGTSDPKDEVDSAW